MTDQLSQSQMILLVFQMVVKIAPRRRKCLDQHIRLENLTHLHILGLNISHKVLVLMNLIPDSFIIRRRNCNHLSTSYFFSCLNPGMFMGQGFPIPIPAPILSPIPVKLPTKFHGDWDRVSPWGIHGVQVPIGNQPPFLSFYYFN